MEADALRTLRKRWRCERVGWKETETEGGDWERKDERRTAGEWMGMLSALRGRARTKRQGVDSVVHKLLLSITTVATSWIRMNTFVVRQCDVQGFKPVEVAAV